MYVVNTHLKPVIGIDIHFVNLPFPFVPLPHPYIGLVIDPFDYIPFIGATVKVNGVPRGNTDTNGMIITFVHIPEGAGFTIAPIIGHNSQNFFGSKKVMVDGAPMSGAGYMLMTCNDIGIPLSFRPGRKFIPIPSLYLPTSFCIPLQWGKPVNVGGPLVPNFSLMALLKAFVFGCFLKVLGKISAKALKKLSSKLSGKLGASSKLKSALCKMGFEPVDLITGRVNYEYTDFELPGPIPIQWSRTWDSDASRDGLLGHGTHLCYDRCIQLFPEEGALALWLADGRTAAFPLLLPGEEYYHAPEKLLLRRKQNGHFLLEDLNASLYLHFNHASPNIFHLSVIENYSGHRIQFHYTGNSSNFNHRLNAITDSAGRRLFLHYDNHRHITRVEVSHKDITQTLVSYEYNEEKDLTAITDAMGQTTQITYYGHLMTKKTDRNGVSFYWEYDNRRRCMHTYGDGGVLEGWIGYEKGYSLVRNSLGELTTFWYDEDNRCVQEMDHYRNSRYTEYTDEFEIYREIDELGNVTGYVYDDKARLKEKILPDGSSTQFHYNEFNWPELIVYPDGSSETYGYDEERRLQFINYPDGKTVSYSYNDKGQLETLIDNGRKKTIFRYDEDENLVQMQLPTGGVAEWKYDALGRCLQTVNPEGQQRHYDYDALGRLRNMYLPDGERIALEYNAYEEVTEATGSDGRISFEYTSMGKLKKRKQHNTEMNYIYDTEERLKGIVNEAGKHYRLTYNSRGEIISETGFDGLQRKYGRDEAGKVIRTERPGDRYTEYEYDANGRVIRIGYHDGYWEVFRYSKNGDLLEAANEQSTIKFERNKIGKVETEWQGSHFVKSSYDKYGERVRIDSFFGEIIEIERNELGASIGMKTREWSCRMRYNKAGDEIERLLPGGISSERVYDHAGRPAEHKISRNGVLQSWKKYTWNTGDRLTQIFDAMAQTSTRFRQDGFGNLVFAQYADGSIVYRTADDTGNLYETREMTDRKFNSGGALQESAKCRYKYDEEGNLVCRMEKATGKTWHYRWQGNGMLAGVTRPDGREVSFRYDALGRRTEKIFDGMITRFLWDGNMLLHEWKYEESRRPNAIVDGEGNIRQDKEEPGGGDSRVTWIYDADSFVPAARIKDGQTCSIISDYLGTPREMYDDSGKKVWEGVLDIYGRVRSLSGERDAMPFRYQGQYEDIETGLYYNRFRYYSAEDGIYLSQDPIGLEGGNPTIYGYVSEPNTWIDPFGLECSNYNGRRGEARAAQDLERNGFQIVGRQVPMNVNGHNIKADFVATRNGNVHVFEVKTNTGRFTPGQKGSRMFSNKKIDMANTSLSGGGTIRTSKGLMGTFTDDSGNTINAKFHVLKYKTGI